jgi:hypothetical protein
MTDGEGIVTQRSEEARIDLVSAKQRTQLQTLSDYEDLAHKRTLEIRTVLGRLAGNSQGASATI